MLNSITPFFIVDDLAETLQFYKTLGLHVHHKGGDGQGRDFWAMVGRDQITLMLEHIAPGIHPQPNHSRHDWAARDAYVSTRDRFSLCGVSSEEGSHPSATVHDGRRTASLRDHRQQRIRLMLWAPRPDLALVWVPGSVTSNHHV